MLDLGFVRANLELVEKKLRARGADPAALLGDFRALDQNRREAITTAERLKAKRPPFCKVTFTIWPAAAPSCVVLPSLEVSANWVIVEVLPLSRFQPMLMSAAPSASPAIVRATGLVGEVRFPLESNDIVPDAIVGLPPFARSAAGIVTL